MQLKSKEWKLQFNEKFAAVILLSYVVLLKFLQGEVQRRLPHNFFVWSLMRDNDEKLFSDRSICDDVLQTWKHIDIAFLHIVVPKHQFLFESINFVTQCKYVDAITLQRTVKHNQIMRGLVAFVTGAASGLGKRTAFNFLVNGSYVISLDKEHSIDHEENFDALCAGNNNSLGDIELLKKNCAFVKGDVTCTKDVATSVEKAQEEWGSLDVAINCAGVGANHLIYNTSKDRCHRYDIFQRIVNTNLIGTFNVVRLVSRAMAKNGLNAKQERGVIITTSSIDAFQGRKGGVASCAAAGGIASLTLPVARDLASLAIRVVAIAPGYFDTPMISNNLQISSEKYFLESFNTFPYRVGHPDEFFRCVQSIIDNQMINGEIIKLDAGCFFPYL
ncbi:unnamed protein product [Clavelina lepadiformis]|uniref:3-hydroxyacyl-CoA dehydrogenase type-2 n=1 Tax=Clavelina lepadiformis TaxID=159417 RepID=A0ABP0FUC1_CLALP